MQSLVRMEIFSKAYEFSVLSRYMKTGLYTEWIKLKRLNASLKKAR